MKGKIYLNESGTIFVRSLDQMFDALNAGLTEIRSSAQFQQYQVYVASNADSLLLPCVGRVFCRAFRHKY